MRLDEILLSPTEAEVGCLASCGAAGPMDHPVTGTLVPKETG